MSKKLETVNTMNSETIKTNELSEEQLETVSGGYVRLPMPYAGYNILRKTVVFVGAGLSPFLRR